MHHPTSFRPFLLAALAAAAGAHELDVSVSLASPSVVLRATYAGADPVAHAQVQVFAPGETAKAEYQTARTDRRGYFSFVPGAAGAWRVTVDDEEGHQREIAVTVPRGFAEERPVAGPVQPPPASRWERALLGLALLLGATGVLYGLKARGRAA